MDELNRSGHIPVAVWYVAMAPLALTCAWLTVNQVIWLVSPLQGGGDGLGALDAALTLAMIGVPTGVVALGAAFFEKPRVWWRFVVPIALPIIAMIALSIPHR